MVSTNGKEKEQSFGQFQVPLFFTKRREGRRRLLPNLFTTFLRWFGLPDLNSKVCCAFIPACVSWNFIRLLLFKLVLSNISTNTTAVRTFEVVETYV